VSLVLVRHGRTEWNRERRLVGRSDVGLDDVGREQASAAGALLFDVAQLRSSPLRRARETAELLGTGRTLVVDEAFIELDYGRAEGRRVDEVSAEEWRRIRDDETVRWPDGESLLDLQTRVGAACDQLFATGGEGARDDGRDVVVVSHVGPIKAAVAWALGTPGTVAMRLRLDNGSITRIGWGLAGPVLVSYNVVPAPLSGPR
jgi:broad specificity phosphatase PhoE